MKKLVLIGGGEVGRGTTSYEIENIDKEIVKMTNKENPNFLFIGLASSYSDSYYDIMKKIYKNLGCEVSYLKKKNIINNKDIVENKIEAADIIYIGGGDTIKLLHDIKENNLEILLKNAYLKGTVIVGISAGAIALSKEGFSDSLILRGESNNYEFIKGLDFINISICPHYNSNVQKTKELDEKIKDRKVYALENCTALKVEDDNISYIKSQEENSIYLINNNKKEKLL